jgi:hypothetical protein
MDKTNGFLLRMSSTMIWMNLKDLTIENTN